MRERLYSGTELRAEGRRLLGAALRYGDVSPSHRERFEAGSIVMGGTLWLDYQHDPSRILAHTENGGLTLRDTESALNVEAVLPNIPLADKALSEVRAGVLKGFSIEFTANSERVDDDVRVIERASLAGIGLVKSPSYEQSKVEARAVGARITGSIPFDKTMTCRCHRGECDQVRFESGAFDDALSDDNGRDVLLITDTFSSALASKNRQSLTLVKGNDALRVIARLPGSSASKDLIAAGTSVNLLTRPVFDQELSEYEEKDGVAVYSKVHLKAVLVGASDVEGWPIAKVMQQRHSGLLRF